MATQYTDLLGFALPVTGELDGTWGDTVNNSITELVEDSIAGTATASVTSGDWTLSTTGSGDPNEARCAILIPTGTPGTTRNIVAPSQSKAYIVDNQSNGAVVLKGSATTGTTITAGVKALCAWNGFDFVTIADSSTFSQVYPGAGIAVSTGSAWGTSKTSPTGDVVGTSDSQTLTNKTLTDPAIIGTILEDVYTITDGAAFEIDPGNGSIQLITLGASRTPKATNFAAGESVVLMVDDGSAYSLTWTDSTFGGSGVLWKTDGGTAPALNTSGYTAIVLWKVGTQIYGARVGDA